MAAMLVNEKLTIGINGTPTTVATGKIMPDNCSPINSNQACRNCLGVLPIL